MSVSVPAMNSTMTRMSGPLSSSLSGPLSSLLGYEGSLMVGAATSPRASPRTSPHTSPHHSGWGCPPIQVKQEPSDREHDSSATSSGVSSMAHGSFMTNTSPSSSSSAGSPPSSGYSQPHAMSPRSPAAMHSAMHSTPLAAAPAAPAPRALSPRSPAAMHNNLHSNLHTPLGAGPASSPSHDSLPAPHAKVPRTPGSVDDNSRSSSCSNSEDDAEEQVRRLRATIETATSLQCQLCNFTADTRDRLADHVASHFKCSLCDFAAGSPDSLRAHLQEQHDLQLSSQMSPEHSACDNGYLEDNDEGVATPRVNSQGKVKTFRCKQCEFVAVTKLDFWEHTKLHIKQEKLLCCPKCPFVTEYKHHLEYHLRNHFNSKPFKCDKCSYSCVNKSMLNSHLKSHSNVYQYRCADCTYATKYCHSLKLHLRKYGHQPSMVLNPDGTPNPLPIIDVYGTRRGPKTKTSKAAQAALQQQQQQQQQLQQHPQLHQQQQHQMASPQFPHGMFPNPYGLPPIFPYSAPQEMPLAPAGAPAPGTAPRQGSPMLHRCTYCEFTTPEADVLAQHVFVHAESNLMQYFQANNNNYYQEDVKEYLSKAPPAHQPSAPAPAAPAAPAQPPPPAQPGSPPRTPSSPTTARSGAVPMSVPMASRPGGGVPLDLSKPDEQEETTPLGAHTKNRRKGRAFKLERIAMRLQQQGPPFGSSGDEAEPRDTRDPRDHRDPRDPEQLVVKVPRLSADLPAPRTTPAPASSPDLKPAVRTPSPPHSPTGGAPSKEEYNCSYCDIAFRDIVMYTMHMGYHGYQDPFQCNMCGQQTTDKVSFFLHIARSSHS